MEIPFINSDSVAWTQIRVPSNYDAAGAFCPPAEDCAGGVQRVSAGASHFHASVVWRMHRERPSEVELLGLSASQDLHQQGLRLIFEDALSPFVVITPSQVETADGFRYQLVAITVSGILYTVRICVSSSCTRGICMTDSGVAELDLSNYLARLQQVTSFTAAPDIICVGGQNGSVLCIPLANQLNMLQDGIFELKDGEAGLSRLWGLVSRGKAASPVVGLAVREVNGISTLFSFHEEGALRTWDLMHRTRLLQHIISTADTPGFSPQMMWVEEPPSIISSLKLAVLYGSTENSQQMVLVCSLNRAQGEVGKQLSHMTLQQAFPVDEGKIRDIKVIDDRLWILRGGDSSAHKVHRVYFASLQSDGEGLQTCFLQELAVKDHLLQGPGHTWDDMLFAVHQLRADVTGVAGVTISEIFLRRLFQPGMFQFSALQEVLKMRGRQIGDVELRTMPLETLKKEITLAVQSEGNGENRARAFEEWFRFGQDYVMAWNQNSLPFGLLGDAATGVVGLIRRNSVSIMRSFTGVEQHVHGGLAEVEGVPLSSEWQEAHESAVLAGVLRCTSTISRHLGRLALAAFHEALLQPLENSFRSLTTTFMAILDVGYSPRILRNENPHIGVDEARDKEREQHQRQRKFSLQIFHLLRALKELAGSWDDVIGVIEKYATYLMSALKSPAPSNVSRSSVTGSFYKKTLAQATCQISLAHFEASRNLFLLLGYIVKVRWQAGLTSNEVSRIQLVLIPQVQEALTIGLLLHWLTVTPAEAPPPEDFSSQLSSLQIDGPAGYSTQLSRKPSWERTLADILAATYLEDTDVDQIASVQFLPPPEVVLTHSISFTSWLLQGNGQDGPTNFSHRAIALSIILLQHGQYGVLENFIITLEEFLSQQKLADGNGNINGDWSARLHLLGFSLLARACSGRQDTGPEKQVGEAIRCFFRAASGMGEANEVLQALFVSDGQQQSLPARKLHYFEWIMQIFERYNLNEGARRFAHAALEQVDDAVGSLAVETSGNSIRSSVADTIKGRLWANIFKFSLDLELYGDAYCAIVSNPDGESKHTCLRRFVVVLCERKAAEVLCGHQLPYVGLLEQVEQELAKKAENSGIITKPSPYKLLYAFHMHRHNWRKAAACIYHYVLRVRNEGISKSSAQTSYFLQEQLNGISAAMNALLLVESAHAWIECLPCSSASDRHSPTKRPRIASGSSQDDTRSTPRRIVDHQQLEKEYALAFARMQLLMSEIRHPLPGESSTPGEIVHLLVECGLYENAFSLLFLFWKDSSLTRELETVIQTMARKCCSLQLQEASPEKTKAITRGPTRLLLTNTPSTDMSNGDEMRVNLPATATSRKAWQALQSYLTRYKKDYPHFPVVVAETILSVHENMELPLWLVDIFRGGRHASEDGMAGHSADPAALLRIYLDFDHVAEATNFLLESLRAWGNLRPADVIKRKRTCAVWFPYMLIDRLRLRLSELASEDGSELQNLQSSLETVLRNHFVQIKTDSEDVRSLTHSNGAASF